MWTSDSNRPGAWKLPTTTYTKGGPVKDETKGQNKRTENSNAQARETYEIAIKVRGTGKNRRRGFEMQDIAGVAHIIQSPRSRQDRLAGPPETQPVGRTRQEPCL